MKITEWAGKHRVIIAALSVVGSFAGLVFATLDLQTALQEKKLREILDSKE